MGNSPTVRIILGTFCYVNGDIGVKQKSETGKGEKRKKAEEKGKEEGKREKRKRKKKSVRKNKHEKVRTIDVHVVLIKF